jgi:hypothetical protein
MSNNTRYIIKRTSATHGVSYCIGERYNDNIELSLLSNKYIADELCAVLNARNDGSVYEVVSMLES